MDLIMNLIMNLIMADVCPRNVTRDVPRSAEPPETGSPAPALADASFRSL
jgi:hypothetical protein